MEGIYSPHYKIIEVNIYQDLVRPHHLASIGGNINVLDQIILQIGYQEYSPQMIW